MFLQDENNLKSVLSSSFLRRWTRTEPPCRRWRNQWRQSTIQDKVRPSVSKFITPGCALVDGWVRFHNPFQKNKNPQRKAQDFLNIFNKNEDCFFFFLSGTLPFVGQMVFCVCVFRLSQKPTPEFVLLVAVTWILSNFPLNTFESSLLPENWQFQMFVPQKSLFVLHRKDSLPHSHCDSLDEKLQKSQNNWNSS